MAYDVVSESVALIEAGHAEPVRSLTRRRRFAAMAVDVSGDLAVTMFARRGAGCVHQEIHQLVRREDKWTWLGGGSSSNDEQLLADRPSALSRRPLLGPKAPVSTDPRIIASGGGGGVRDSHGQAEPSVDDRWISYCVITVSSEVASVEVFDRNLRVPWHGDVLVVWCGDPSNAVARDTAGRKLAELRLA